MQISDDNKAIIDRIRELRIKKQLSQANFAKLISASPGNVGAWETYKALPSAIALKNIAKILECSSDWILFGTQTSTNFVDLPSDTQKSEIVFDPATRDMIDAIKLMMSDPDPDVRAWAKVQFRRTFADYLDAAIEKKEHA